MVGDVLISGAAVVGSDSFSAIGTIAPHDVQMGSRRSVESSMAPKRDDDWASDLSSSAGRHQTRPRHENRSPGAQRAGLVLIADDNRDARELYGLYLSHVGFSVELVADGLEAVNTAMKLRPDVIVMDLTMPRLDGIEATRRLKASSRTRDIPVVLLTGHFHKAIAGGARDGGVDLFLTKPCLPEDLEMHVRELLERKDGPRR